YSESRPTRRAAPAARARHANGRTANRAAQPGTFASRRRTRITTAYLGRRQTRSTRDLLHPGAPATFDRITGNRDRETSTRPHDPDARQAPDGESSEGVLPQRADQSDSQRAWSQG